MLQWNADFFTNSEEEKKLQEDGYQNEVVQSIINGIKYYEVEYRNADKN